MPELVLNGLFTEEHPDGRRAWLTQPLMLLSPVLQAIVLAPRGFLTDYTSHPLWTSRGPWNRDSVGHDWLYEAQTVVRLVNDYPSIGSVTRHEADMAYREWLEASGTPGYRRHAFYAAVRLGGWLPWSREDREEHRPYRYDVHGGLPASLPETLFGHPSEAWMNALWDYTSRYELHRQFSGGPPPEPDPIPF